MDWYYLAFISAILSAAAAIIQKKVLFDFNALEFSFVLSIVNALIVLLFISQIDFQNININGLVILYFKTIFGALAFWCVMLAIKNMEISGALPLMVLTPGLVAISSYLFLGESIHYYEILGMVLLLLGTYILEVQKSDSLISPFKTFLTSRYHHYIVYAILLFTISSVIDKLLLREYRLTPFSFVVFQQIFLAINFTFMIIFSKRNIKNVFNSISFPLFLWILIISVATIGYRYTQIEAVKIAPVALVLSIKRTSVFFASIFGGKIFSEHNLVKKSIAIIIMLIGAYLLT